MQENLLHLENIIDTFLKSKEESVELPMTSLDTLDTAFQMCDFREFDKEKFETNGWEIDFFQPCYHLTYGDFILSGSLYYGNYKLTKNE